MQVALQNVAGPLNGEQGDIPGDLRTELLARTRRFAACVPGRTLPRSRRIHRQMQAFEAQGAAH